MAEKDFQERVHKLLGHAGKTKLNLVCTNSGKNKSLASLIK